MAVSCSPYVLLGEFPHEGSADRLGLDRLVFLIQIFPQALVEQLRYLTAITRLPGFRKCGFIGCFSYISTSSPRRKSAAGIRNSTMYGSV